MVSVGPKAIRVPFANQDTAALDPRTLTVSETIDPVATV
jgi:hypothetical protein